MIEKIKELLEKLAKEDIDAGIQFENCEITINDRKIKLKGNLDLEVTEK